MGCGEFQHVGSNGEVMATGQWGNVFLLEKGRWLMLQESAHLLNLGGIADAGTHSFQDIRETERSNPSTAAFTASETMARDYLQGWTNRDPEQIVNLFHHTGTRVVSAVKGVTKHHKNLRASHSQGFGSKQQSIHPRSKVRCHHIGCDPYWRESGDGLWKMAE